jgi:hypothetical protein
MTVDCSSTPPRSTARSGGRGGRSSGALAALDESYGTRSKAPGLVLALEAMALEALGRNEDARDSYRAAINRGGAPADTAAASLANLDRVGRRERSAAEPSVQPERLTPVAARRRPPGEQIEGADSPGSRRASVRETPLRHERHEQHLEAVPLEERRDRHERQCRKRGPTPIRSPVRDCGPTARHRDRSPRRR